MTRFPSPRGSGRTTRIHRQIAVCWPAGARGYSSSADTRASCSASGCPQTSGRAWKSSSRGGPRQRRMPLPGARPHHRATLVVSGDLVFDVDLGRLIAFHRRTVPTSRSQSIPTTIHATAIWWLPTMGASPGCACARILPSCAIATSSTLAGRARTSRLRGDSRRNRVEPQRDIFAASRTSGPIGHPSTSRTSGRRNAGGALGPTWQWTGRGPIAAPPAEGGVPRSRRRAQRAQGLHNFARQLELVRRRRGGPSPQRERVPRHRRHQPAAARAQPMHGAGHGNRQGAGDAARRRGARLDDLFLCPHHPDGGFPGENAALKIACGCRKPAPGMLHEASARYDIDSGRHS